MSESTGIQPLSDKPLGETESFDRAAGRRRSDRLVAASRAMQEAIDRAMAASRSEQPVDISGPPGCGKEHIARAIHAWSDRARGPLVTVSCGAVPEPLLARELFGCAENVHPRLPEAYIGGVGRAAGGTLVIDSLERAPASVRASVFKVLADGRYSREGETNSQPLETRLIFTGSDAVAASALANLPHHAITLLPLSERPEDVLPLAAHFLRLAADEEGVTPVGFTADARSALLSEPWNGNVRELSERVRQAVRLAGGGAISAEALLLASDTEAVPSFKDAKRAFETRYVVGLLRRCGGNISRAARLAKKDRKDFYDVIRRTGVNPAEFR